MILDPLHQAEWFSLRHIFFRVATYVAFASILANLLPNTKKLDKHPDLQCAYEFFIFVVAALALNWRACLPSLDAEFFGFKVPDEEKPLPHVKARWQNRRARRKCKRR